MAGINTVSGQESILFADNASFDGSTRTGAMTLDGQLWIGSTALPHVKKGTLTAGTGITVTNGSGSISIATTATVQTTGTFSPTLTGSVSNPSVGYNMNLGFYTRLGRFIYINIVIWTSSYSGGSGNLVISGLPFTSMNGTGSNTNVPSLSGQTFTGYMAAAVDPNTSTVRFASHTSNAATTFLATSAWHSADALNTTIEYCA